MSRRRIVYGVAIVQAVGAIATLTWEVAPDALGPTLWATSFLALLPGDILGPWMVETALWQGRTSLRTIAVLDLLSAIVLNLGIAWLLIASARLFRRAA